MRFKIPMMFFLIYLTACSNAENGYRIEGNKVLYQIPWNAGHGTQIKELNADPNTFEVMSENNLYWARDKDKVFWRYYEVEVLSSISFEYLGYLFAKDKDKVVCRGEVLKEADAKTFKVRNFININGNESIYGLDKSAAYFCSRGGSGYTRIVSDSIEYFKSLGGGFSKDDKNVWWAGILLVDVNLKFFKVLEGGYATDGKVVYYRSKLMPDVDIDTFKVTSDHHSKDKNHKYYMHYIED